MIPYDNGYVLSLILWIIYSLTWFRTVNVDNWKKEPETRSSYFSRTYVTLVSLIKGKDQIVAVIQSERENVAVGVEERYKNIYSKIWEHNNGDKMSCEHDMRELEKQ